MNANAMSTTAAPLPAEDATAHVVTAAMAQHAALLRLLIRPEDFKTIVALAEQLGRDPDNTRKTLAILVEDGALEKVAGTEDCGLRLTDFGRLTLQGFDLAEGRLALPAGYVIRTHGQLQPHPLNPRKDWSSEPAIEALDELRQDIVMRGVRLPLEIRSNPEGADYIVSGERRWRALGLAIHDGDIEADTPVVCVVKDVATDAKHVVLAFTENSQHHGLTHMEEARSYAYLRDVEKWGTDRIADELSKNRKVVQNKLRLLEPKNSELAARVERGEITYHQALQAMIEPKAPQGDGLFGGDLHQQKKGEELKPLELTPKQALVVIELADRCEKHPHGLFDGYTQIAAMPTSGDGQRLLEKGIISGRSGMGQAFAKVMLYSANVKRWLTDNGFYEDRGALLHSARAAIVGTEKATQAEADGLYVTDWLNLEPAPATGPDPAAARTLDGPKPQEELTPEQVCALVEIVAKAHDKGVVIAGSPTPVALLVGPAISHPLLKSLCWGGYIVACYASDYQPAARYTDVAIELLDRLDLNPLTKPRSLRDARQKAGAEAFTLDMMDFQERYLTDALNVPEPEAEPERPPPSLAPRQDEGETPPPHTEAPAAGDDRWDGDPNEGGGDEGEEDEDRFPPRMGALPAPPVHVVPLSSQNLQAGTDFARLVSDRLARTLAQGGAHWSALRQEEVADVVIGLIEDGDFAGAAANMAALLQRSGHAGAGHQLARALARHLDRANQEG